MLSKRNFCIATGFYGLFLLGCSQRSNEARISDENNNHEIYAISEILGLFVNHPIVKGLSFLRILDKELREIRIERNKKGSELAVNLKTKNEGVGCTIDLYNKNSSGIFIVPNKEDPVYFSPDGFIRTNNISNENELEYW
jgi:hypothetical protein